MRCREAWLPDQRTEVRTLPTAGVTVVDGAGATLMPGMCEAHTHFGWTNSKTLDAIQKYCRSVGETDPLYFDDAYAKSTPYGGIGALCRVPSVGKRVSRESAEQFRDMLIIYQILEAGDSVDLLSLHHGLQSFDVGFPDVGFELHRILLSVILAVPQTFRDPGGFGGASLSALPVFQ